MFNNFLYLKRLTNEISIDLIGKTFFEAYSQEKDHLLVKVSGDIYYPDKHIVFSTSANSPIFYIKKEHKKAKKNVINIFQKFLPATILNIQICQSDRIIKFNLSTGILYFFFSGPKTNVLIKNDELLETFKKADNEFIYEKINLISTCTFYNLNQSTIFSNSKEFFETKDFQFLYNVFFNVYNISPKKDKIINLIEKDAILVGLNSNTNKLMFLPKSLAFTNSFSYEKTFSSVNDAILYYFSLSIKVKKTLLLKQTIEKYINSELEKLSDKLNKLKLRIEQGNKEELYRYYGNLILTNLYDIKKIGNKTIAVFSYEKNDYINIEIKPELNLIKNAEYYFSKAASEKINYNKSVELFQKTNKRFNEIIAYKNMDLSKKNIDELEKIIKELKIVMNNEKSQADNDKFNFKTYLIQGKYKLYVGKDSNNNDILTTKFAKQNDFWFHVKGTSGSHAVLRVENLKEPIPKSVLKSAAAITAFHSKAKTAGTVPVLYTLKKYVIKRKGMNPGQVSLLKEEVLLVKPEIPSDCEYISDVD